MTYSKGIGALAMIITIGTLVAMTIVGFVIQKKNIDKRIREEAKQTTTVAEPTTRVQPSPTQKAITASDITDTKLDKDFSDIDASVNAITVEGTAIDTGLNDQMGDLSE